jgi:DNA-binding transcriptional LysR family regulator
VELTEVGRVFLRGTRRTLASAAEAVAQAQEAAAGERGRLFYRQHRPARARLSAGCHSPLS